MNHLFAMDSFTWEQISFANALVSLMLFKVLCVVIKKYLWIKFHTFLSTRELKRIERMNAITARAMIVRVI